MKWLSVVALALMVLTACEDKDPKVASGKALIKAMKYLQNGDKEKYYNCLDFGQELDSLTQAQVAMMWVMHQQINQKVKGQALATDVVKVELLADTVALVYYKIKYESGNEEVSSNKMVCRDGEWKIRIRN